ncbi:MAG: chorismate mutase [Beijerinckiaceae bacterium]|nr:chorismate mutase [Beijerinckiaceae bacterium]MCZ8300761.1 chorismate mutase [Beijerinckiaceae bacterium]
MSAAAPPLAHLRQEIDRIDAVIHAALVERGEIVGQVIAAKNAAGDTGSAFRPDREADLMRRIVLKAPGRWPVDAPENIWRVIVATSTFTQVPYRVHADLSGGDVAIRESMRFHFGFTVPFVPAEDSRAVIAAVAASLGDLGMFRIDQSATLGAWWKGLEHPAAPKIIARLPFAERADHPVGLPVFVIARPQKEGLARETILASVRAERWRQPALEALAALGAELVASAGDANGANLLIAHPAEVSAQGLTDALEGAKCAPSRYIEIGCHARRFRLGSGS